MSEKHEHCVMTVRAIEAAADTMEETAARIRRIAKEMSESGDLTCASDVINAVTDMIPNLRLDLMVTRPLRALSKP